MIMRLVSLALMLSLIGCTLPRDDYEDFLSQNDGIEDLGIGPWKNEYPDDQRVVGIWIQQFPDGGDASPYEGKHPCMVYYIFPDGRQHGFHYEPDGITESQGWSHAPDWILEQLDIVHQPEVLKLLIERAKERDAQQ